MIDTRIDGHSAARLSVDQLRGWSAQKGLLWIDASSADPHDIEYLNSALTLHPLIIEDIEHSNQRPKVSSW